MPYEQQFALEPFTIEAELGEAMAPRDSAGFVRWLQTALNRALGLRLPTDGVVGPQTRSAIRSFQQRQGLKVDGIVGPATEARLRAAGGGAMPTPLPPPGPSAPVCRPMEISNVDCDRPAFTTRHGLTREGKVDHRSAADPEQRDLVLWDYDINDQRAKPAHQQALSDLIKFMSEDFSQRNRSGRWTVSIAGLASRTGSEAHNDRLSEMRAACVERFMRFHLGDFVGATDQLDFFNRVDFDRCFQGFRGSPPGEQAEFRAVRISVHRPGKAPPPIVIRPPCRFRAAIHGFKFANSFSLPPAVTVPLSKLGIPIGSGAYGLCGGMAFLAGDHFSFGVAAPATSSAPPIGSALHTKIVSRQLDSLNLNAASIGPRFAAPVFEFMRWMKLPDRGPGSTAALTVAQFRGLKPVLERRRLAVLGLVLVKSPAGSLTENHQVLAHCITERSPSLFELHVYDPNFPGRDDVRIVVNLVGSEALTSEMVPSGSAAPPSRSPIRGFFVMAYRPKKP